MDKAKEFVKTYRAWDQGDVELGRELEAMLTQAELLEEFTSEVEANRRLNELHNVQAQENTLDKVEKALDLLEAVRRVLDRDQVVALFELPDAVQTLEGTLKRRDELDVFRSLVLGAVRQSGAIAMDANPDDNRLVTLIKALMP